MAWRWGRGRERAFVTVLSGETVRSVGICESTYETLEAEGGNIFKMRVVGLLRLILGQAITRVDSCRRRSKGTLPNCSVLPRPRQIRA